MNRSKLEYLLKDLSLHHENEIVHEMDPEGKYLIFDYFACKFLADPDTTDPEILMYVPGSRNPAKLEAFKNQFRAQYRKINDLCAGYGVKPFFPNPDDIKESEAIRRDLVAQVPESYLNKFFGVNSFYDYKPKPYIPWLN